MWPKGSRRLAELAPYNSTMNGKTVSAKRVRL